MTIMNNMIIMATNINTIIPIFMIRFIKIEIIIKMSKNIITITINSIISSSTTINIVISIIIITLLL